MGVVGTRQYIDYVVICIKIIHRHMSVYTENIFGRILEERLPLGCLETEIRELALSVFLCLLNYVSCI